MNQSSIFRSICSSALCAALAACAGTSEPLSPTVVRTRAPQGYEKTITSYLAFKIRSPQPNAAVSVGAPEPGECPLDGYRASSRGWVVPVIYSTRTGVPTGKEAINITARPYYFWFLGDTIAGITPRLELCPGAPASEFVQPGELAEGWRTAAVASPTRPESQGRQGAAMPEAPKEGRVRDRARVANVAKQISTTAGKTRPAVRKIGNKVKNGAPSV